MMQKENSNNITNKKNVSYSNKECYKGTYSIKLKPFKEKLSVSTVDMESILALEVELEKKAIVSFWYKSDSSKIATVFSCGGSSYTYDGQTNWSYKEYKIDAGIRYLKFYITTDDWYASADSISNNVYIDNLKIAYTE